MTLLKYLVLIYAFTACSCFADTPPNIVVILTDDQGYADISFNPNHPKEVSTPHMDKLAKEGVFFSQAYTSGHVCSPTRAGLMLGRYQQREGFILLGMAGVDLIQNYRFFQLSCLMNIRAPRSESGIWD